MSHFPLCNIDLDPMPLILKLDLDMVKMLPYQKMEVFASTAPKDTDTTKTLPAYAGR